MDIKLLKSKINLMEAQVRQFSDSSYFSPEETDKLCKPLLLLLDEHRLKLKEFQEQQGPEDIDVVGPEIVK